MIRLWRQSISDCAEASPFGLLLRYAQTHRQEQGRNYFLRGGKKHASMAGRPSAEGEKRGDTTSGPDDEEEGKRADEAKKEEQIKEQKGRRKKKELKKLRKKKCVLSAIRRVSGSKREGSP